MRIQRTLISEFVCFPLSLNTARSPCASIIYANVRIRTAHNMHMRVLFRRVCMHALIAYRWAHSRGRRLSKNRYACGVMHFVSLRVCTLITACTKCGLCVFVRLALAFTMLLATVFSTVGNYAAFDRFPKLFALRFSAAFRFCFSNRATVCNAFQLASITLIRKFPAQ